MENTFTPAIRSILKKHFGDGAGDIFAKSQLIQYINKKTRSANKDSKARSSFASIYAIYVIIEDYLSQGFDKAGDYSKYEGAYYKTLLHRQRQLPFGSKLQNHALNNRMNSDFQKFFPSSEFTPILRNLKTKRYRINDKFLMINVGDTTFNIAQAIMEVVDAYVKTKQDAFQHFVNLCGEMQQIGKDAPSKVKEFIIDQLEPRRDARLFEIVSYSILKYFYYDQQVTWGFEADNLKKENLKLFKTGRTNANDGGIDFVMTPVGRFFQVTETLDFKKFFLDIDKIQKYPITFVIKSKKPTANILDKIRNDAAKAYATEAIVIKYMDCIEEIINIPVLIERFNVAVERGHLSKILEEIIIQGKVEFNFE